MARIAFQCFCRNASNSYLVILQKEAVATMLTNPQVIAIGKIFIDFVSTKPGLHRQAPGFEKCLGGAPMNTIVGVSRLGVNAGAIAAVGDDPFGQLLIEELKQNKVDISQVKVKNRKRTTITFVANEPMSGGRTLPFYRRPWIQETAASALEPDDIDFD